MAAYHELPGLHQGNTFKQRQFGNQTGGVGEFFAQGSQTQCNGCSNATTSTHEPKPVTSITHSSKLPGSKNRQAGKSSILSLWGARDDASSILFAFPVLERVPNPLK
jgi:hypothetical protein